MHILKNASVALLAALVVALAAGCKQQASEPSVTYEDKVFALAPNTVKVEAGIVSGEISDIKVTERVEKGSGRVAWPAKLTGSLKLKNTSTDQAVRLIGGKLEYVDAQGQVIKLAEDRTEPTISFSTYTTDRLDPGQETTQSLDVAFPAAALKKTKLKEIRLELAYIPTPYKEETLRFNVMITEK